MKYVLFKPRQNGSVQSLSLKFLFKSNCKILRNYWVPSKSSKVSFLSNKFEKLSNSAIESFQFLLKIIIKSPTFQPFAQRRKEGVLSGLVEV